MMNKELLRAMIVFDEIPIIFYKNAAMTVEQYKQIKNLEKL